MITKTNKQIQAAVDLKNGGDLRAIADYSTSANDFQPQQGGPAFGEPSTTVEQIAGALEDGIRLVDKLRKIEQSMPILRDGGASRKTLGIYKANINDALGPCYLYFVGTLPQILKRLEKLQDTNK